MVKKRYIVVLATAWGPKHGGMNSFNYDLCRALPTILAEHQVVCVTLAASQGDEEDAAASGVKLISLQRDHDDVFDRSWSQQVVAIINSFGIVVSDVDWWIGHDVKSGELALDLARDTKKGHSALVMHMSYDDYAHVKHTSSETAAKVERQRSAFAGADVAFAVGPLLYQRAKELRKSSGPTERLIPGLPEPADDLPNGRLCAITFGRFEPTEALIKQAPLAVAGFAAAIKAGRGQHSTVFEDAALHVVGVPDKEQSALTKLAESHANRLFNVQMHPFIHNRSELRARLTKANLSMMLSWHEGFGLTGWEAIGIGIPTIISHESGVFRLLNEIGGHATGCVQVLDIRGSSGKTSFSKDDLADLCRTILTMGTNLEKHLHDANELSRLLRTQLCYSWASTATSVAKVLGLPMRTPSVVGATGLDRRILREHPEIGKYFDEAAASNALSLADAFIKRGQYDNALQTLEAMEASTVPDSMELDLSLLKGEVLLRLNRYALAEELAKSANLTARDSGDPCRAIRAESILNAINRDQGNYDVAVSIGRDLVARALEKCPEEIASAKRKLSRALALQGAWQEALKEGNDSLTLAKSTGDALAEAKALLALGEAYRHGLDQLNAIPAYVNSRNLAGKLGHIDCYLWAAFGLADSLFLVGELKEADSSLAKLEAFIQSSKQGYPLETFHMTLSRLVIAKRLGHDVDAEIDTLIAKYGELGVEWPGAYVYQLRLGNHSLPKKF